MYRISNLSYGWNSSKILFKNITCTIPANSLTAIIGPNGSGKSTLVRLLLRLLLPNSGNILFDKQQLGHYSHRDLADKVAYVSQNPNQPVPLLVKECVGLGWHAARGKMTVPGFDIAARIDSSMALAGVSDLADRLFLNLSMGEKQKVMLARALCQTRSVLALDEPTASLDFKNQLEIMHLLQHLVKNEGVTVIMVSHDLNLIQRYATHILAIQPDGIIFDRRDAVMKSDVLSSLFKVDIRQIKSDTETVFVY